MPNAAKGARLYLRGRAGRKRSWVVLDTGREVATGCDEGDREQAEKALADYIARKYHAPHGPHNPDQMTIGRALEIYGNERAPHVACPERIGYAIDALEPFWGELPVSAIKGETCRAYVRSRNSVKEATARRELETLCAAINYCHKEGYLLYAPRISFPKKATAKTRWLTRHEAARLLWAARHVPHLRTFILIGLYTGTRSGSILQLQWLRNMQGGWIDLDAGLLHRGAEERIETNKRQPICPLPVKLVAHLARARKRTVRYAVEFNGERVAKLRRSWRSACDAAGLGSDVTPHTLRHTAVTWRLQAGVDMWSVAGYVGMSEKMVRDTYGHHCPDHLREARDAI
jgi:site-specific recombinase XerC